VHYYESLGQIGIDITAIKKQTKELNEINKLLIDNWYNVLVGNMETISGRLFN
jgi:hypothetical protein